MESNGKDGSVASKGKDFLDLFRRMDSMYPVWKSLWLKKVGYEGKMSDMLEKGIALMDHGFWSDEKRTGCGTCRRVCPVGDISMAKGKPVWNHPCEQGFVCLHWCPREALQFEELELGIGERGGGDG